MLDGYGSRQSTVQPQKLVWENVAINSILAINNLTQPHSTKLPQLIRIPILIFDIGETGAFLAIFVKVNFRSNYVRI